MKGVKEGILYREKGERERRQKKKKVDCREERKGKKRLTKQRG